MESYPRLPFIGLCLYLCSQAITVPLFALGNWSVWPTLPDLAWLAFACLSAPYALKTKSVDAGLLRIVLGLFVACTISFVVLTVLWPVLYDSTTDKGKAVGLYQVYRLGQFLVLFWLATKVPLPPSRVRILHYAAVATCTFVCLSCVATYWFVPTSFFGRHLAGSLPDSGPWIWYIQGLDHMGVGTIGYNHGYTGLQIILLAALAAHTRRPLVLPRWLLGLAFVAIFISEHRTGLIFFVLYICLLIRPSAKYLVSSVILLGLAGCAVLYKWSDIYDAFYEAIQRQSTITTSYSTDRFSARDQIWTERLDFLNENPARWIVGSGFGSAFESGPNGHMLYLHIVIETGLMGLLLFGAAIVRLLGIVWQVEYPPHPLFWAAICFLGTCLAQETFYPVAAFGHFIGLFLCAVAIAIRSWHDEYSYDDGFEPDWVAEESEMTVGA